MKESIFMFFILHQKLWNKKTSSKPVIYFLFLKLKVPTSLDKAQKLREQKICLEEQKNKIEKDFLF